MAQKKKELAHKKKGFGIRITIIKIRDKEEQEEVHSVIKKRLIKALRPYTRKSVLYFIEDFSYDYNGLIE